jgi:integrase/recombinase XerC
MAGRYGWTVECETAFGTFPVAISHEWNTIAHLKQLRGYPGGSPVHP